MTEAHALYHNVDVVPSKGLVRNITEAQLRLSAFSNVINMRVSERPELWIARDGQRAFRLYSVSGGVLEPDQSTWFVATQKDYGNYVVGEVPLAYAANNDSRQLRYNAWVLWLPRHQDTAGQWNNARIWWGEVYDQRRFVDSRNQTIPQTYNPTDVYGTVLFLVQRTQHMLRRANHYYPDWCTNYSEKDYLRWGKIYNLMIPSLSDDLRYQALYVTAGLINSDPNAGYVPTNAVGWLTKYVLSADWSWQSAFAVYGFSTEETRHFPWTGVKTPLAGCFGEVEWSDGDWTNPLYWSGRVITLGNYMVLTHPGMLQEYFIDTLEGADGIIYSINDSGVQVPEGMTLYKPWRKDYLIGDVVVYDGESVGDVEQRNEPPLPVVVQENSVGRVGADILELDLRLGSNEENDMEQGVETGIGLYKFYADVSYTLAEDLSYDRSVFEVLRGRAVSNVISGWYAPDSVWSVDTGSGYFAQTHVQYKTSILTDGDHVSEDVFAEDYKLYWGKFNRHGYVYTGYDLEAWNDLQHKAFGAFLALYRWSEEVVPFASFQSPHDGIFSYLRLQPHPMMLFYRLDRRDGNNWLYTKTLWGTGRRPFLCGWTRIDQYGKLYEDKQESNIDVQAQVYEASAPAWSNALVVDADNRHVFTGVQDTVLFPDLLKQPVLYNPVVSGQAVLGEESQNYKVLSRKDIAADVFIWADVKIRYYPSSGRIRGSWIETFFDRLWTKLASGSPRTYQVNQPDDTDPNVIAPVAGWSYRFVYEYHDGTFSAPSPVYQAPTLLFSPIKDAEIAELQNEQYKRPLTYSGNGTEAVWHPQLQPYNVPDIQRWLTFSSVSTFNGPLDENDNPITVYYPVVNEGSALDKLMQLWGKLRQALYSEQHVYHTIAVPDIVDTSSYYRYVDALCARFTLITVYDDTGTHAMGSITPIGEGLCIADTVLNAGAWDDNSFVYRLIRVYGRVPFIPASNKASYNSLFSAPSQYGGLYRMTYRRMTIVEERESYRPIRHWDYMGRSGEYLFFPLDCLRDGGPSGTIEAYLKDPADQETWQFWTVPHSTPNVPLYKPLVPLQPSDTAEGLHLVWPWWALRRRLTVMGWDRAPHYTRPVMTLPPGTDWLTWGIDVYPCSEVENSWIQICWDGESQTTTPLRWASWPYWDYDPTFMNPNDRYYFYCPAALWADYYQPDDYLGLNPELLPHGYSIWESGSPPGGFNEQYFNVAYHYHPAYDNAYHDDKNEWGSERGTRIAYTTTDVSLKTLATACGLWNVLRMPSSTGTVDKYVYINIICPLWERNNEPGYESQPVRYSDVIDPDYPIRYPLRVPSVVRYVSEAAGISSLGMVRATVPPEVTGRLLLSGKVPLHIAVSRWTDSSASTLVSFAGTRKTYFAHYVSDEYTEPAADAGREHVIHRTMFLDFTDEERKGAVANVPHVKSRWTPIITGHALSNIPSKRRKHKVHREIIFDWILAPSSYLSEGEGLEEKWDLRYYNLNLDDTYTYHHGVNLYSDIRDYEPHWMLPDGVLVAQWEINVNNAILPDATDPGRALHHRENPRAIPPLRFNLLREIQPFVHWAFYKGGMLYPYLETWNPPNDILPGVTEFVVLAKNVPKPYIDFPAWGVQSDGPLANAQYPPTPWRARSNWWWKYVPLQAFAVTQVQKDDYANDRTYFTDRGQWWYRPYWIGALKIRGMNYGVPPTLRNLFDPDNYADTADYSGQALVVQFPKINGNYVYPDPNNKARIIAAYEPGTVQGNIRKILPMAYQLSYGITDLWYAPRVAGVRSLDCVVYMQGHRTLYPEQLTMYYTSKMLFDAPRLGLWFRRNAIPPRVKRIHIYRSRHIDDNQWHPDEFGYVGSVDARWSYNTEGERTNDLYFFDNVPDSQLDFGDDITRFEALDRGLSSVAATVLSERAYYGNIVESYMPLRAVAFSRIRSSVQPQRTGWGICGYSYIDFLKTMQTLQLQGTPRSDAWFPGTTIVYNVDYPDSDLVPSYDAESVFHNQKRYACMVTGADTEGYLSEPYLPYYSESESIASIIVEIDRPEGGTNYGRLLQNNKTVCNVLYGISHPVDNIERTLVWSTADWQDIQNISDPLPTWQARASVNKSSGGSCVDWGVAMHDVQRNYGYAWPWQKAMIYQNTNAIRYVPWAPAVIYRYASAIRWSDLRQPQVIRGANIEFVRSGDGDEIVALAPTYNGNLLVFKHNSIVRLMLAGGFEIARRDQVSDTHGLIGPHAWAAVGNFIIFVSHDGVYAYDDNSLQKIDGPVGDELYRRLQVNCRSIRDPLLTMTRVWYNQNTNEVYINIPVYGDQYAPYYYLDGNVSSDQYNIPLVGDVYIYHIGTQTWSKIQYPSLTELHRLYRQVTIPNHVSGWMHHIRNYYTDMQGRNWAVPLMPSTVADGGQVYLEGPHHLYSIWANGIDDVFGELSFTIQNEQIVVDPSWDVTHAPPHNIYRRQVRSLMSSPSLRDIVTIKFKPRVISVVGYWYNSMSNTPQGGWAGYVDQYSAGLGYEPQMIAVLGLQVYNQDVTSYANRQYTYHQYLWNANPDAFSYSIRPLLYRDRAILSRTDFTDGGEFTFVPARIGLTHRPYTRAEEVMIHTEAWGKFVLRAWHIVMRPQENYLR